MAKMRELPVPPRSATERERVAQEACVRHSTHGCCCDPHVLVRSAVVKQPSLGVPSHSFDKDDIRNLSNFFPVKLGRKYRLVRACGNFCRIMPVEQNPAGCVEIVVISAAVD